MADKYEYCTVQNSAEGIAICLLLCAQSRTYANEPFGITVERVGASVSAGKYMLQMDVATGNFVGFTTYGHFDKATSNTFVRRLRPLSPLELTQARTEETTTWCIDIVAIDGDGAALMQELIRHTGATKQRPILATRVNEALPFRIGKYYKTAMKG